MPLLKYYVDVNLLLWGCISGLVNRKAMFWPHLRPWVCNARIRVTLVFFCLPPTQVLNVSPLSFSYVDYMSLTLAYRRISAALCTATVFSIFPLFCFAASISAFLILLVFSAWASLPYFFPWLSFLFIPLYHLGDCILVLLCPCCFLLKDLLGIQFADLSSSWHFFMALQCSLFS